jgi:transposase
MRNPRFKKSCVSLFDPAADSYSKQYHSVTCLHLITMPTRTVSHDLKARIPVLRYEMGYKVKKICVLLGVKKTLVYTSLKYFESYGVAHNPYTRRRGRRRHLSQSDRMYLIGRLEQRSSLYLDELRDDLLQARGTYISLAGLVRCLKRLDYSRKRISPIALERNAMERSAFMNRIADLVMDPDQLMFTDESARNARTSYRTMGRSLRGVRCTQRQCRRRGQRVSILPVMTMDGIITHDIIPGSVNGKIFLEFLQTMVVRITLQYASEEDLDQVVLPRYLS